MMFRIALQMARTNLVQLIRDRRALFMLFVMPMVLIAILGNAFGGVFGGKGIPQFTVAVVNQDAGQIGAQLNSFLKSQTKQISVVDESTLSAARMALTDGKADVVVSIPTSYSTHLTAGQKTQVEVEAPLNHDTQKSVTQGMIEGFGQQLAIMQYMRGQGAHIQQAAQPQELQIQQRDAGLKPIGSGAYYAIGMMVMFMLVHAIDRSSNMVEQKDTDLYRRLIASPASRIALTVGNWVAHFLVMVVQGSVLLLMARWLLDIHFGPISQTAMLLGGYAFSLSGISIALGSWVQNQDLMSGFSNIASQIAAVLGGSIWPVYNFPHFMQIISHVLPNGIIITAMVDSVMGISNQQLLLPLVYLVTIGLVLGLFATVRYGRRLA